MSKFDCLKKNLIACGKRATVAMLPFYQGTLYVNMHVPSFYQLAGPCGVLLYISDVGVTAIDLEGYVLSDKLLVQYLTAFPLDGLAVEDGKVRMTAIAARMPQRLTETHDLPEDKPMPVFMEPVPDNYSLYMYVESSEKNGWFEPSTPACLDLVRSDDTVTLTATVREEVTELQES